MHIKMNRIVPLVAAGAAAVAIAAAPMAAAATGSAGSNVQQSPGNVEITATPGGAAQEAAQAQQPFGGDMNALEFHHRY
jgi:ABC-type phosphate/phosphonate transport system substrate-binding protein